MPSCKPYGNQQSARVLVIGHDPRLQNSEAQARYVFFLDYLERPMPSIHSEKRKYSFAESVVGYISHLGGGTIPLQDMYFTNLCNEFLDRPINKGTVLISNQYADKGINAIEEVMLHSSFKVILPMSPQVFYHLVRAGFVADDDENLQYFWKKARPRQSAIDRKVYTPTGKSPFLMVCGQKYTHRNDHTPVIPILHVKQWPLNDRMKPHYGTLMKNASANTLLSL